MLNIFTITMSKNLVAKQFHIHSYLDLEFKKQRERLIHVQRKHIKHTKVPGCTIISRVLFERFAISTKHGATTCTKWRMLWAGKLETLRSARIIPRGNKQRERKREAFVNMKTFVLVLKHLPLFLIMVHGFIHKNPIKMLGNAQQCHLKVRDK